MSVSKQNNLDSFGTFLKNVSTKNKHDDAPVNVEDAPMDMLTAIASYAGPVAIQTLQHDFFAKLSITRLARGLGQLQDMELVNINDEDDSIELTDSGKTTCKILPKLGKQSS